MGQKAAINIIHIDDNSLELKRVKKALEGDTTQRRFYVESYKEVSEFRSRVAREPMPEVLVIDFDLSSKDCDGLTLAQECRATFPHKTIILLSGHSHPRIIASAFASGADDFICKHTDMGSLSERLRHCIELANLKKGVPPVSDLISGSAPLRKVPAAVGNTMEQIKRRMPFILASAVSSISVEGESGTGKEIVADILESCLPVGTPFIRINCAEIAPSLMESELFGYKKGAFTGATEDKPGLIEAASGGWVFLDEITLLPPQAQGALLRVLENKSVRRIGEHKAKQVDIRLLAAGNESLSNLVKDNKFRNDLWQRISEVEIKLLPLRTRPSEIPKLIDHFCKTLSGGPYLITDAAKKILMQCGFSNGNVRELRNTIKAMTELKMESLLTPLSIPDQVWERFRSDEIQKKLAEKEKPVPRSDSKSSRFIQVPWDPQLPCSFQDLCDQVLSSILLETDGQQSLRILAKSLKISRVTLATKIKRLRQRNLLSDTQTRNWTRQK